jgi:hypothetical protein
VDGLLRRDAERECTVADANQPGTVIAILIVVQPFSLADIDRAPSQSACRGVLSLWSRLSGSRQSLTNLCPNRRGGDNREWRNDRKVAFERIDFDAPR